MLTKEQRCVVRKHTTGLITCFVERTMQAQKIQYRFYGKVARPGWSLATYSNGCQSVQDEHGQLWLGQGDAQVFRQAHQPLFLLNGEFVSTDLQSTVS